MSSTHPIRFEHDDDFLQIMDKVNHELKAYNLVFEHNDQVHDGFVCYQLKKIDLCSHKNCK